jgi:hypothetical protein
VEGGKEGRAHSLLSDDTLLRERPDQRRWVQYEIWRSSITWHHSMEPEEENQRTDTVPLGNANLLEALGDRDLFNALLVISEDVHRLLGQHGFEVGWVDEGVAGYGGGRHCCSGSTVVVDNNLTLDRD